MIICFLIKLVVIWIINYIDWALCDWVILFLFLCLSIFIYVLYPICSFWSIGFNVMYVCAQFLFLVVRDLFQVGVIFTFQLLAVWLTQSIFITISFLLVFKSICFCNVIYENAYSIYFW